MVCSISTKRTGNSYGFSGNNLYEFTCLPFGLASEPCIHQAAQTGSELLAQGRDASGHLHGQLTPNEPESNPASSGRAHSLMLEAIGFIVNHKKLFPTASQDQEILVFRMQTVPMSVAPPDYKQLEIMALYPETMAVNRMESVHHGTLIF